MVQFFFLMGINVYGWRSSGVNHVLIFELDPRNHLSEQVGNFSIDFIREEFFSVFNLTKLY